MTLQDKTIQCYDCGTTFIFGAEEQELFRSKGHTHEPKRCPSCRQARKARQSVSSGNRYGNNSTSYGNASYGYRPPHQIFQAVCAGCGKKTEVPFQPRAGKPVYCSDCYRKVRLSR